MPVSPRSSLHSSDTEELVPIQLDAINAEPGKPSAMRRISNATSSFFLPKTSLPALETESEGNKSPTSKLRTSLNAAFDGLGYEEYVGADQLQRSLSRRQTDDEIMVAKAELKEFFPENFNEDLVQLSDEKPSDKTVPRRESTVRSTMQNFSNKLGFWDEDFLSQRAAIAGALLKNYVYLILGFSCALCIYWGSYFNRTSNYTNIQFAVIIGDAQNGGLTPVLGTIVSSFFQNAAVRPYGNFDIWNYTQISTVAASHGTSLKEEVIRQVHHQNYQAAFFVHENATAQMYRALVSRNSSFNPSTDLLSVFYETGSDYNAMNNFIKPILQNLSQSFLSAIRLSSWSTFWVRALGINETLQILAEVPTLLTALPSFQIIDRLPVPEQVIQAPLQMGLIYLCIFTFFQFLFTIPIYQSVATKIRGLRFVAFRIVTAQISYVVLSLAYVVLNTAFGISFTRAFGNSGFLVIWAISFLTMSSIGSIIEILVLLCVILKPPMIGVVLLLVSVLNLAPTISPIYLCPKFYRYGYAMPVYNSYRLLQAAYFNSWKGNMGRYIGILVAWSLVSNACMPFMMKWVSVKMKQAKLTSGTKVAA